MLGRIGFTGIRPAPVGAPFPGASAPAPASEPAPPPPATAPHFTGSPAERRFAWADDGPVDLSDGYLVALVQHVSPVQALRRLVPHPRTPIESAAKAQAWADAPGDGDGSADADGLVSAMTARSVGHGWTIVLVWNGLPADMSALSRGTRAVEVVTNIEAPTEVVYAVHGDVERDFDPDYYQSNLAVDRPLPQERGIRFGDEKAQYPLARSFQLVERLTGIRVTPAMIEDRAGAVGVGFVS